MLDTRIAIRPARLADLPLLADIERRAAALFPESDLPPALRGAALPFEALAEALLDGQLWVADDGGLPVGFALAERLDGQLHLAEMDVDPDHARRGLGAALLRQVLAEAARRGCAAVTLTTFAHLPWNAPFYRRHGFQDFAPAAGSQLAARLRAEAAAGFRNRVALRRAID
ncbi:GNAT family N-acetyltransferase [Chromobacterium amazonense]|uniref:GNAT family N-acetyltransferase n=1 Tax=Chromobacterium amazonense TaxID=1382803 RepID=A0ABU8V1T5_9NEIS|nr:GNAT family N-acetyltransferase [Chromobacterium amazonense]MDQ4542358.1 GNAT family N-acetyltransferase [Chromobacterium amazonense]